MKINSIRYKDKKGLLQEINLERQDGNCHLEFFISGPAGSGKTKICKEIWDCWQANLFYAEENKIKQFNNYQIEINGSFNDNSPFLISNPPKMSTKMLLSNKVKLDGELKNTILFYPSSRNECADESFNMGQTITGCALPMADLEDASISNCCFIIDDLTYGMDEQESITYIRELIKLGKKNNNQIIMTVNKKVFNIIKDLGKSFYIKEADEEETFDKIRKLCKKINNSRNSTSTPY